jgi:hypothetical protein
MRLIEGKFWALQKGQIKIKKRAREYPLPVLSFDNYYSAEIASVGQDAAQAPQS